MIDALSRIVLGTIRSLRMCSAGDRVAVGVSGGADSTALLLVLRELAPELGVSVSVAHFNHCLREDESDADQEFVAALAAQLELEFAAGREEVAAKRRRGENLEAAARRMRYAFLNSLVAEGRATRVAVAHTADDQAETVLAHITRGTGPAGLAGIYPVAGAVVRPLLDVRRAAVREYLLERKQAWREDSTNRDRTRLRARLRLDLLPQWEAAVSPGIVERLCGLATHARTDEQFWTEGMEHCLRAFVRREGGELRIAISDLLNPVPPATTVLRSATVEAGTSAPAQRLVRRLMQELRGDRYGVSAAHVSRVLRLARESISGRRIQLPDGIEIAREFNQLVFRRAAAGAAPTSLQETAAPETSYHYEVELPQPNEMAVCLRAGTRRLRLKVIDWPPGESETSLLQSALDCAQLSPPLVLRNWQPGDAYRPAGRYRARKLKGMFREQRIRRSERAGWPVLESSGRPVWAAGFPAAAEVGVTPATRLALVIVEENS